MLQVSPRRYGKPLVTSHVVFMMVLNFEVRHANADGWAAAVGILQSAMQSGRQNEAARSL